MPTNQSYIEPSDLFSDLRIEQRLALERAIIYSSHPAGHLFFSPNERGAHVYLLRVGRVRLYKLSPEGRALTLSVLEPVTLFGELPLLGSWLHECFAETMSEAYVGVIARDTLRQAVESYPQVAVRILELLGNRLRMMENRLADIAFKNVPQRLATILLSLAALPSAATNADEPPTLARFTHQQLAEMAGAYRETVTKALGEFRKAGLIRVEGDMITLMNVPGLQQLASR